MKKILVVASNREDKNATTQVYEFTAKENIDIHDAVKKATKEFLTTDFGKSILENNNGHFDWHDFDLYVPRPMCAKYGFYKARTMSYAIEVDLNEHLGE